MSPANILLCEDESIVAMDLQNRLKKLGHNVIAVVDTGEKAIEKAAVHQPDLVLMDIKIRGKMDGIEAAQRINVNFDIPVIYLTGNADESTVERAKITKPFGYLIKPFKDKQLQVIIEVAFDKHGLIEQLKEREEWSTTVLKNIDEALLTTDTNSKVTFINPVAETLTGWKQLNALGRDAIEVFNIADAKTSIVSQHPIMQALQEGAVIGISSDTILISRSGIKVPIEASAAPLKNDSGSIIGAVLIFRDMTSKGDHKTHQAV